MTVNLTHPESKTTLLVDESNAEVYRSQGWTDEKKAERDDKSPAK